MTLIVILNAVLAIGIVGALVALHSRAIVLDHRQHGGGHKRWTWGNPARQPAAATVGRRPHIVHEGARQRRQPALAAD